MKIYCFDCKGLILVNIITKKYINLVNIITKKYINLVNRNKIYNLFKKLRYDFRDLAANLEAKLHKGKVIVLIGPRQVGKTTLINSILKIKEYLFLDGDDNTVAETLANANTEILKVLLVIINIFLLMRYSVFQI